MKHASVDINNRVYIRGGGIVCAIGDSQQSLAGAMLTKSVAATQIVLPQAPEQNIPYYSIPQALFPPKTQRLYPLIDRVVQDAIIDAGLRNGERKFTAVLSGSTACDISDLEEHYQQDLKTLDIAIPLYRSGFGIVSNYIANKFDLRGPQYSFNTACSSSANAIMYAASMITSGRFDNALVVGVEVFNYLSLLGFSNMMLLANDGCKPFDLHRDGTVLGEAVAAVLLSKQKPAVSQYSDENPFYYVSGANLCDTQNITSASSEVIEEVMQNAVQRAGCTPSQIGFIKAHGTGTANNDAAEAQAMSALFNAEYNADIPPFTSLKSLLGHTLGACGVVELVCMLAAIKDGFMPATTTFSSTDPELGVLPIIEPQAFTSGNIMLNYFGFGGNNTSLIVSNLP